MSPSQKDDDGHRHEWVVRTDDGKVHYEYELGCSGCKESARITSLADHRDAQQLRERVEYLTTQRDFWEQEFDRAAKKLPTLRERVRMLEEALRVRGKCFHCQGTGKPNCVTCDDYQACRCRPGEGRYAKHCWNCKGTGLNAWAAALLSPAAATEGGE